MVLTRSSLWDARSARHLRLYPTRKQVPLRSGVVESSGQTQAKETVSQREPLQELKPGALKELRDQIGPTWY